MATYIAYVYIYVHVCCDFPTCHCSTAAQVKPRFDQTHRIARCVAQASQERVRRVSHLEAISGLGPFLGASVIEDRDTSTCAAGKTDRDCASTGSRWE